MKHYQIKIGGSGYRDNIVKELMEIVFILSVDKCEGETELPNLVANIKETTKDDVIDNIKHIILTYGETTSKKLELEASPAYYVGESSMELAEEFNEGDVTLVFYRDGEEMDRRTVPYQYLDLDLLLKIEEIMEQYATNQIIK